MKTITTKPNTFYVKKSITDDIGVMPVFPDAYVGLTTNYDIKSNPDTSFYLGESDTVDPTDFVYGEGNISEIYLNLYVNSLKQSNPQTGNYLDVFMLKPNIDITEGNMTIVSGNYTNPVLYYNSYNDSTNWMVEDFDGTNKAFIDAQLFTKGSVGIDRVPQLTIPLHSLRDIAWADEIQEHKDDEYTWSNPIKNLGEELSQGASWLGWEFGSASNSISQSVSKALFDSDENVRNHVAILRKGADGLYGTGDNPLSVNGITLPFMDGMYAKKLNAIRKPASWWLERGASETDEQVSVGRGSAASYDQFEENFVARCNQDNSIFSQVQSSPDVRDIKDQTLEGPGDNARFISFAYANLIKSESPTDGNVLRMKAFWENYSGSFTGAPAQAVANPFGQDPTTKRPNPQTVCGTIYGIPQPTPIDITTSGTGVPAYAPEIEITFKINDLPETTFGTSGSGLGAWVSGTGNYTLDRSFNIIFNDDAPSFSDSYMGQSAVLTDASQKWRGKNSANNGADTQGALYGSGSNFSPWISFIRTSSTSESVDVYCNANYFSEVDGGLIVGGIDGKAVDDMAPYTTQVPMGEWVTMRIKLNMYKTTCPTENDGSTYYYNASGGASIVYFPGLFDSMGKMRSCLLAHGRPWGENSFVDGKGPIINSLTGHTQQVYANNAHYPNMTLWLQNMRAINSVSNSTSNINATFSKMDTVPDDDKSVDVLIDQITFRQWGLNTNNSTVCVENGMGQLTRIPTETFVTPMVKQATASQSITAGTIAVNPTGTTKLSPDNYYGKQSALTASYYSFGFPEKTVIGNDKHHSFLLNNFSIGKAETALPVTLISGGYFTSGTYNGLFGTNFQNNWFNNLTVGDNTKEIHVTGGTNSIDSFVQKGTMTVKSGFTNWVKTGNPMCGAKIISIAEDKMSIVVDKPNVFDIPLNTPLCVELNNVDYKFLAKGSGSIGYYDSVGAANPVPLVQTKPRDGNRIYLSRPIYSDDANSTAYGTWNFDFNEQRNPKGQGGGWHSALTAYSKWYNTNYNLTKATISPYQYWFNIALINASSSAAWGDSFADIDQDHTKVQQTRAYSGIVAVSGGSTAGTTFNESLFNDGIYANKWNINFLDPTESIVDLSTDYGFGTINSQSQDSIPESDGGVGRVGRDYMVAGDNYINLSSYVYIARPDMSAPFNFVVKPTYMNSFRSLYACNVNTKDATSNPAQLIYGIKDPLPEVEDLQVSSIINIDGITDPSMISNMTQSNATDLKFTWSESGDDVNYRMLWVDTDLIENKYHKAEFIIPLNESVNTSPPKFYTSASNYISNTSVTMDGSNMTPDIEGACGFGQKFDGTLVLGASSSTAPKRLKLGVYDTWTHVFHLKPSDNGTFFAASGNNSGESINYKYEINAGKVKMAVGTSGATAATLESTTTYGLDGKQPLAVVLTWNQYLTDNNFKLYVNGKLEDTADRTTGLSMDPANFACIIGGNIDSTNKYTGFIEEIVFHSKCASIPQNNKQFILKTNDLRDVESGGVSNKYQSRLFLFDYHNIRGTNKTQVCRSNTAAWKVTGVT